MFVFEWLAITFVTEQRLGVQGAFGIQAYIVVAIRRFHVNIRWNSLPRRQISLGEIRKSGAGPLHNRTPPLNAIEPDNLGHTR